jgi:hypothetical protein
MINDCTADCMYCDGKGCPYMKSVAPAHYKIAKFALIVFALSLPLVAYMAIKYYNHNHTYQQVKK